MPKNQIELIFPKNGPSWTSDSYSEQAIAIRWWAAKEIVDKIWDKFLVGKKVVHFSLNMESWPDRELGDPNFQIVLDGEQKKVPFDALEPYLDSFYEIYNSCILSNLIHDDELLKIFDAINQMTKKGVSLADKDMVLSGVYRSLFSNEGDFILAHGEAERLELEAPAVPARKVKRRSI